MVSEILALSIPEKPDIIIVDDNSPDATGQIADELALAHPGRVSVIHREAKQGLGPAYAAGYSAALDNGADLIIQMDCDFSHRPEDIPKLIAGAEDADVVIGSRFCPGGAVDRSWGKARKLLSGFANGFYVRTALGLPVKDATGGFRLWRREALLAIDPQSRLTMSGYGFQVEMTYLAHRLGFTIKEVPIYFPDRARGDSKMSMNIMLEAALETPQLRWRHRGLRQNHQQAEPGVFASAWHMMRQSRLLQTIGVLFAMAFVLRLLMIVYTPLIPEEAYYWMYAKHPNLSYFDHPPMVAWVIGLGTATFGNTELGVRIVSLLMMLGSSLLMYRFASQWYNRTTALISALLLQILPAFFVVGFIATMDSALLFFWMLCVVSLTAVLKNNRSSGWYIAGIALGGALLSKYTGIFLAAGTFLALIAHRPWRRQLLTIHPYLAFALAMLLFSPVIIWNAQHDWASFRFQFINRFEDLPVNTKTPAVYLLLLIAVATPMVAWLWITNLARFRNIRFPLRPRTVIAISFSIPLLTVLAYKSLRYDVHINWGMPALLSLLPVATHFLLARMRLLQSNTERWKWARQLTWTAMVCLVINISMSLFLLLIQPRTWLISAIGPWPQLAETVEYYEDLLEAESGNEPLIIADGTYRLASELAFYRMPIEAGHDSDRFTTSQWILGGNGLGYAYWSSAKKWAGSDCIFVSDRPSNIYIEQLQRSFELVEKVHAPITIPGNNTYTIMICRGFKGTAIEHAQLHNKPIQPIEFTHRSLQPSRIPPSAQIPAS